MEMFLTFSLVFAVSLIVVIAIVRLNLFICQPNEVIIFSGRKRQTADGRAVGYRVIKGGRAFRIPLLEKVDRLDLRTIPLEVSITNAYSKGGIPLSVQGIANIKIAGDEPLLGNALERFLGIALAEVQDIAKDTLEGNLRGVLATFGTIDADYRGEIFVTLYCLPDPGRYVVEDGDRIAQLVVARLAPVDLEVTDKLDETTRGEGGHGSTGQR